MQTELCLQGLSDSLLLTGWNPNFPCDLPSTCLVSSYPWPYSPQVNKTCNSQHPLCFLSLFLCMRYCSWLSCLPSFPVLHTWFAWTSSFSFCKALLRHHLFHKHPQSSLPLTPLIPPSIVQILICDICTSKHVVTACWHHLSLLQSLSPQRVEVKSHSFSHVSIHSTVLRNLTSTQEALK